jgi:hypothetical protein
MRYFLNVIYDDELVTDPDGEDFFDAGAARWEAVLTARQLVGDRLRLGYAVNFGKIEITDNAGRILDTVEFREALETSGHSDRSPHIKRDPARSPVNRRG